MDETAFLAQRAAESGITDADAAAVVAEITGAAPLTVEQFAGGWGGIPFAVQAADGRELIVRIAYNANRPYAHEQRVMAWVAERGIPVPRVLGVTRVRDHPVSVLERIPGCSWNDVMAEHTADEPEIVELAHRIGALLRRVHDLVVTGLTLDAAVAPQRDRLRDLDALHALLSPEQRRTLDAAVAQFWPIAAPPRPSLIHKDFGSDHVFVEGNTVTGIIDWEHAGIGDPARDLAWWNAYDLSHAGTYPMLRAGYGTTDDITLDGRVAAWTAIELINGLAFQATKGVGDSIEPTCALLRVLTTKPTARSHVR